MNDKQPKCNMMLRALKDMGLKEIAGMRQALKEDMARLDS